MRRELLSRLAHASLDTPPPPDTWSIRLSYKLMPERTPPLPYVEQAISCLDALAQLRECGFVEGTDDAPRVTNSGRAFCDKVETDTDRCFFAPWSCLNEAKRSELADLLVRLRDGLK